MPADFALVPAHQTGVEATRLSPDPFTAPIVVEPLAAARFPKLVASGVWSPEMETTCDRLAALISTVRAVFLGTQHSARRASHSACGDAAALLEPVDESPDTFALAVHATVERAALAFLALVRERVMDAVPPEPAADTPTAVAFVAHHTPHTLAETPTAFPFEAALLHKVGKRRLVLTLASGQQ